MNKLRAAKKGEEGENLVASLIEKDSSYHRLINNLILLGENNVSHQIDHILIRSNGIFVIETKNYYGEITGKEDDSFWTRSYFIKGKKRTVSFHNPLKQNKSHIRAIKKIIGGAFPIYCFVVFIQNNADGIDLFNVCGLDSLMNRINLLTSENELNKSQIETIYQLLLDKEAYLNNDDHLNKIKEVEKDRKSHQKEIRLAIEKRICPKCGQKLVISRNTLLCPNCQFKLPF